MNFYCKVYNYKARIWICWSHVTQLNSHLGGLRPSWAKGLLFFFIYILLIISGLFKWKSKTHSFHFIEYKILISLLLLKKHFCVFTKNFEGLPNREKVEKFHFPHFNSGSLKIHYNSIFCDIFKIQVLYSYLLSFFINVTFWILFLVDTQIYNS